MKKKNCQNNRETETFNSNVGIRTYSMLNMEIAEIIALQGSNEIITPLLISANRSNILKCTVQNVHFSSSTKFQIFQITHSNKLT